MVETVISISLRDRVYQEGFIKSICPDEYMEHLMENRAVKTAEKLKNKRILIWGYGREGKSTEAFIREFCEPACVDVFEGPRSGVRDEEYDIIFVSPGIAFEEPDRRFTSQTQMFMEEFGQQTVGITGTKGKSTTSSMLYEVLKAAGKNTFLMGNIGKPCFDYIAQMEPDTIAVFELSCHQCQRLTVSPHIAVFLNLYEDHLDRYITRQRYFEAKKGITRNQAPSDILYYGEEIPAFETKAQRRLVKRGEVRGFNLLIPGDHNQLNAEFVCRIATEQFGCEPAQVRQALSSFRGLAHRLQYVDTIDGVMYYDDSISTIPEATISAALSVRNTKTMIVGGMDRNIDYDILADFIKKRQDIHFILAYASGKRILGMVKDCKNITYVEDLDAAVRLAAQITPEGGACVMSPAAASYGYFKNFEERGDYFQKIIKTPAVSGGKINDD